MTQKPTNNGGPAYPVPADQYESDGVSMQAIQSYPGMSLRDYFAGQALASISGATDRNGPAEFYAKDAAKDAYSLADAMLAEREKGGDL